MIDNDRITVEEAGIAAEEYPVLALRGLVLFPRMILHFDVGREKSIQALNDAMTRDRKICLVAQKNIEQDDPAAEDLFEIGVVAEIRQIVRTQGDSLRVVVDGKYRARIRQMTQDKPFFKGLVEEYPVNPRMPDPTLCEALVRTVKDYFEDYCSLSPKMPRDLITAVLSSDDPFYIAEFLAGNLQIHYEDKQKVLELSSVTDRLRLLLDILGNENQVLRLEQDIQDKVRDSMDKNQREYYLREQIKVISGELGEEDPMEEADSYRKKVEKLDAPEETKEHLYKEIDHLAKMPGNSNEATVVRGYLDAVLDLPWNTMTKDKIDVDKAEKLLDKEHYGMKKVKERVLEALAVRKLAPDITGQILCLIGPPGVGKTSIAKSIAKAMGRKYARMSLGGVRDESDIRGHRKTYIGSMPGRVIQAMRQAKSKNPLILLDEIDKLGSDYKGDPSSALLEVLDGEQNNAFVDHFIEVPFDLSKVFFIATANDRSTIPGPLLDRMEIIELPSYTREEKFQIAKKHLVPKQVKRHGLTARRLSFSDSALYELIDHYTKEAGVRTLERQIASLCRKASVKLVRDETIPKISITGKDVPAYLGTERFRDDELNQKDEVGLANGLAWTSVGGEMLQVEAAVLDGSGKNAATGSLGDVMKESVEAAVTYIRSVAPRFGISKTFYKEKDLHIHFPEGAVPKDGPSAGITTCTALISALSGIPVRHDVAMTGEITLRGRVLPIGGLREKTMAAYKNHIKTIIIPKANEPDLDEVEQVVKDNCRFVLADRMETVLETALVYLPEPKAETAGTEEKSISMPVTPPSSSPAMIRQ